MHTGIASPNGDAATTHDGGRVTFFGPNKIEYCHIDNQGRLGTQFGYRDKKENGETIVTENNSPLSINGLVDGVHYRYVVGIKSATTNAIVLDIMLLNLDTNTKVVEYLNTSIGKAGGYTSDYVSGSNIVMYGRYNAAITLDKIYSVYENVSNINAIDKVSEVLSANA